MTTETIELNPDLVRVLRPLSPRSLREAAEEMLVLELYRRRQISSGKAATLLNMTRWEFVHLASYQGIPFFDMNDDEMQDEFNHVSQLSAEA